jgi:hypothetical protein
MSTTDPGGRSAAEIERDVDRERERVADTIDALQSKLSARAFVDEASRAIYEHGGDIGRTLGRQLRDNPLPALLTGVGLVWLMTGSGARAPRYGSWDDDHRDVYRTGQPPELTPAYGEGGFGERASEWGHAAARAAADAAGSTRAALAGAGDSLAEGGRSVQETARQARDWGERQAGSVQEAGRQAREWGGRQAGNVQEAGRQARDWSGRQMQDAQERLQAGLEGHPLVLGGIAFALGAALGAALPNTRAENELVGRQADRIRRKVGEVASEEADKATAVASAVVDEGKEMVEEAAEGLSRNLPDADTVAESAREAALDAADRLRTAGEIEAERRKLGEPGAS